MFIAENVLCIDITCLLPSSLHFLWQQSKYSPVHSLARSPFKTGPESRNGSCHSRSENWRAQGAGWT